MPPAAPPDAFLERLLAAQTSWTEYVRLDSQRRQMIAMKEMVASLEGNPAKDRYSTIIQQLESRMDTLRRGKLSDLSEILDAKIVSTLSANAARLVTKEDLESAVRKDLLHVQDDIRKFQDGLDLMISQKDMRSLQQRKMDLGTLALDLEDVVGQRSHQFAKHLRDNKMTILDAVSAISQLFGGMNKVVDAGKDRDKSDIFAALAKQQETIQRLEKSVKDLQQANQSQQTHLRSNVDSLQKKLTELESRVTEIPTHVEKLKSLASTAEKLESKLMALSKLNEKYESLESKQQGFSTKIVHAEDSLSRLSREQNDVKAGVEELRKIGKSARDEVKSYTREMFEVEGKKFKDALNETNSLLRSLQQKLDTDTYALTEKVDEVEERLRGVIKVPHDEDNWDTLQKYNENVIASSLSSLDASLEAYTRRCEERINAELKKFSVLHQKKRRRDSQENSNMNLGGASGEGLQSHGENPTGQRVDDQRPLKKPRVNGEQFDLVLIG
ncbi:hypothetical protein HDU93_000830 [Gonapodya sp. JEL0774]|nr:hypothetical protein HDU93_000830 [Gonapodya sp. JEL0774]